ncbi:MAG: hypothetical protein KF847_00595 [Pirellulales bacterium]|nr:hypothetical protein [Pirellulales bacterium]
MRRPACLRRPMPNALPVSVATETNQARGRWPALLAALVAWGGIAVGEALAIDIVKIEEFWELKLGEPDGPSSAPQVAMVMSPTGDVAGDYFVFTLNHRSHPDFVAGGMQVQRWHDEDFVSVRDGDRGETLHHQDETVSWVQRLTLDEGRVVYEVVDGASDSWGAFGDEEGELRLSYASTATNLNSYRPAVSIEQSGVSFAGNRVKSLTLTRLRWTDSVGQVYELVAPIDVDTDLDP